MLLMPNRQEYIKADLPDPSALSTPWDLLKKWWQEALDQKMENMNAATLATVDSNNFPDARVVLIKNILDNKIYFFTNYNSQKAKQINKNNRVALVIFWGDLERQIRIRGLVYKTTQKESHDYFNLRPRGSQIAAVISKQSQVLENREILERDYKILENNWGDKQIPCPDGWGGYILEPESFEFWQGRANRLHDRLFFAKRNENSWAINRLYP